MCSNFSTNKMQALFYFHIQCSLEPFLDYLKKINFKCVADSSIRMRGHVLYIRSVEFCSRDAARLLSPSVHDPTLLRLLLSTTQPVPTAARLAGTFTTALPCKLAGPRPTGTQTQLAVFLAVPTRHSAENLLCEKMDKS